MTSDSDEARRSLRDALQLSAAQATAAFDLDWLPFETTDALPVLDAVFGQERAVRAIEFSLGMDAPGYHLFASGPDGFERLLEALGLPTGAAEGDAVHLRPEGLDAIDGVVDYRRGPFLGIRTADALYCFFGRNAFGGPVGMSIHHFGPGVDPAALQQAWARWLEASLA